MGLLGTYDSWKTTDDRDGERPVGGCRVCHTGDDPPCSEECARVDAAQKVRRYRAAAGAALRLVRRYVAEGDGLLSPRVVATLARFGELRDLMRVEARRARA